MNIEDVHIRYEDDELIPDHPFAFGIVIRSLSAQSTDSEWVSYCLGIAKIVIKIEIWKKKGKVGKYSKLLLSFLKKKSKRPKKVPFLQGEKIWF